MTDLMLFFRRHNDSDGTTDVTRTWHFGQPTPHQIDCYTRVLKGQISLGTAIFPAKTKVIQLVEKVSWKT